MTHRLSLYIPAGLNINTVYGMIDEEGKQIANIKKSIERKRIIKSLKNLKEAVDYVGDTSTGFVIFADDVCTFVYPYFGKKKLYWCDNVFYIEPLVNEVKKLGI